MNPQDLIARAESRGLLGPWLDDAFRRLFPDGRTRGFRSAEDERRFAAELPRLVPRRNPYRGSGAAPERPPDR